MKTAAWVLFVPGCLLTLAFCASSPSPSKEEPARFNIHRRVAWDVSRVVGSPEPPLPFRARRAFPHIKFPNALYLIHEPGSDRMLAIHHQTSYGGPGKIVRFRNHPEVKESELFLEMNRLPYGIAFHPRYEKNGHVFVCSNGPDGKKPKKNRLARFTVERKAPFRCDPKSELIILEWETDGHNGGDLAFGPDGYLYITSGDGTSDSDTNNRGQDLTELTAKVLRIDVDRPGKERPYSIPPDNPFIGRKDCRPETWAYGLRNPWKLSYDHRTNQLWVGNNGQDLWEQAYLVRKGDNYGWAVYEGTHPFHPNRKLGPDPHTKPTVEHHHSEARSLTGGYVYQGDRFPELKGAYIYGDYSTGRIWGVRHDGKQIVWHRELADTTLVITGFGLDARGEIYIIDHQEGFHELERRPEDANKQPFPRKLSETGLFLSTRDHLTHPGLIPYSVNAPLWSDGADKDRYLALPGLSHIDFNTNRGWNFPEGTVLVKTFTLDVAGKETPHRIETRLLTKQQGEWVGYSYLWNDEQTDAELVGASGMDRAYEVKDAENPEAMRRQTWHYPSRQECMVCHSRAANFVLGLTELQMNRVHDYGGVRDHQFAVLERLDAFKINAIDHLRALRKQASQDWHDVEKGLEMVLGEHTPWTKGKSPVTRLEAFLRPPLNRLEKHLREQPRFSSALLRPVGSYRRLVDPYDPEQPLDARARSYLHANCSICHVDAGGGNAAINLEFTADRDRTKLFDVAPMHTTFGIPDARLIVPGHPEKSVLLERLTRRGRDQMPPLATSLVDEQAVQLMREWIRQMK